MKFKKSVLGMAFAAVSFGALATEGAWEPVVGWGWSDYDNKTDLEKDYDTKLLGMGYYLSSDLSLELLGSVHNTSFLSTRNPSQVDTLSLRGLYHFQEMRPGIVPYIAVGVFGRQFDDVGNNEDSYGGFDIGLGLKTYFSERFAWRMEINGKRSIDAHSDTQFWTGISYAFGGSSKSMPVEPEPVVEAAPAPAPAPAPLPPPPPADGDKDGVIDEKDSCLTTPMGVKVDERGCAVKVSVKLNVLFATNSSLLTADSDSEIERLAGFMTQYPETSVTIEGHTSSTGADSYNQWLSERRAESVAKAVIAKGIAAERVKSVGYGETKPIADNATEEGRSANRRVVAELEEIARK